MLQSEEAVNLTSEQIVALAPDEASVKAGRGLGNTSKWTTLGKSDAALWGECRGSGSKPYRISIDLSGPAFKCSCPSRKFPCKHGLGLMFLTAETPAAVQEGEPPTWVSDWLDSRRQKAEKKVAAAAEKKEAPVDPEGAARRAAKRLRRMKEGGEELGRWLGDQVRSGIAAYPQQPASYFNGLAARMVDAQVPGLANEARRLESLVHTGDGWPRRVVEQLGRMHLLAEGLRRFEALPDSLQGELRACLGWSVEKEEVLTSGERIEDEWCVVGQVFAEREKLWERRSWLLGHTSKRAALLLDFSHGTRSFPVTLPVGSSFRAELFFYAGSFPLRAILAQPPADARSMPTPFPACPDISSALTAHADALALNPWLQTMPLAIDGVTPIRRGEDWLIQDASGIELPLTLPELEAWEMLAVSGGHPVRVFGEWSQSELRVLSFWAETFHGLAATE